MPRRLLATGATVLALVLAGGLADASSVQRDGPLVVAHDARGDVLVSPSHPAHMDEAPYRAIDVHRYAGRKAEVSGRPGYLVRMKIKDLWADAHPRTDAFAEQFYFWFYDRTHAAEVIGFKAGGRIGAGTSTRRDCHHAVLDYRPHLDVVRLFVPRACLRHQPTAFLAEAGLLARQWPRTYQSSDETVWVDFR